MIEFFSLDYALVHYRFHICSIRGLNRHTLRLQSNLYIISTVFNVHNKTQATKPQVGYSLKKNMYYYIVNTIFLQMNQNKYFANVIV